MTNDIVPVLEQLQNGAGALLCLAAVGVLVARWRAARRGEAFRATRALGVLALLAGALFLASPVGASLLNPRAPFHYGLGAKYYDELGHYALYRQTLLAAQETGAFDTGAIRKVRHLEDLSFVSVATALEQARAERPTLFTEPRWEEFKQDVEALSRDRPAKKWKRYLRDHGYNPPPVRNVLPSLLLPSLLLSVLDLGNPLHVSLMQSLDLVAFLAALAVAGRLLGPQTPLLVFIFVMTAWYAEDHLVGNFLNYLWLSALVLGMVALRTGRNVWAGAGLGVAASLRLFPLLLMAGPVLVWLRERLVHRRPARRVQLLLLSFGLTCGALGLLGLSQGNGVETTREFIENIRQHTESIRDDSNKIGLRRAMSDRPGDLDRPTLRRRWLEAHPGLHRGAAGVLLALFLVAVLRGREDDRWAIPLGIGVIFAGLTLSRYYYLALAILLVHRKGDEARSLPTLAAVLLLLNNALWLAMASADASLQVKFSAGTKAI